MLEGSNCNTLTGFGYAKVCYGKCAGTADLLSKAFIRQVQPKHLPYLLPVVV